MPVREFMLPPLDIHIARPISPGGCPSAGDVDMASPTFWASLPDRPRTSESRRPSFSASNAPDTIPPSAWRIQPGQYIAFSIDKEAAAAAAGYVDGSKEKNAILQYPAGRYIGLVVGSYVQRADDDSRWLEELVVMYVARAPPAVPGAEACYVPIAPFQVEDGGSRGPPLRTKTLFPWKDRAQWTTFGTRLQIQTLHESKLSFDMDDDEFARFELRLTTDHDAMEQKLKGADEATKETVEKLRPASEPLPAIVWRDIRGEHGEDPTEFVTQIYALDE
ncbi:hypothetical protein C8Q70DRAFT_277764 [Cubamyces menziesii]|uniref:Uncharacterized protein n=1 Tax=Trametes cubensis TaxID=1111947 RepID=A0AAD7TXQ0_9APHY|nr:hypothetical protein C8Q70DRAFT_277764 [Cubamyces menziesii]KAJ8483370.1 hypothetical protein ONZ51_g4749 [Trametes cubensis]